MNEVETAASEIAEGVAQVTSNVTSTASKLYDSAMDWASNLGLNLISAIIVFLIGWFLIKGILNLVKKALIRSSLGEELYTFILSIVRIVLIVMLAITCAGMLNINITSLVTALGAAGLAVGLALQSSLTNLAGGVFILITKPFVRGDFVDIGGLTGSISEIQMVHTVLLTADNKKVFIPNGDISSAKIINYSAEEKRRLDLTFHVPLDADFQQIQQITREVVENHPLSLKEPAALVRVGSYTGGKMQIECKVWVLTKDYWDLYYDLTEQEKVALNKIGVQVG